MSIVLPGSTTANLVSEYTVTNLSLNNQVYADVDGFLKSSLVLNLNYEKREYVTNEDGHKIAVINKQMMPATPTPGEDTSRGYLFLDAAATSTLLSKALETGSTLEATLSSTIDELIHADLVKRGILTA